MKFSMVKVTTMPPLLEPGILYVSVKFKTAAHLCACGCGEKVNTPLGPTWWSVEETPDGPSLTPSIGNWQQPCRSHYWIYEGKVEWDEAWSPEQVEFARASENARRVAYFEEPKSLDSRTWWSIQYHRLIKLLSKR